MIRRQQGHAFIWMLLVILLIIAAALGVARVGRASGDYVRRQVTADAASISCSEVLAERLRHIGRLQKRAQEEIEKMEQEQEMADAAELADRRDAHNEQAQEHNNNARLCVAAARAIAAGTPAAIRSEADRVAHGNGASIEEVVGLPDGPLPNLWFEEKEFDAGLRWVVLSPEFKQRKLGVVIRDDMDRRTGSAAWVKAGAWPLGPMNHDDWEGRRAAED